jgi:regulatory protein
MKITSIKQQVKNSERFSIFIDKRYAFSLTSNDLITAGLKVGQEIDSETLDELKDRASLSKATTRSYHLLSYRARSEWEIYSYLNRQKYDNEIIDTVIERLKREGYINDLAFATEWVKNRSSSKNSSVRKLRQELSQKHVDREIISQAIEDADVDEFSKLKTLIEKLKRQSRYDDELKLMQYLSRQGYGYDDIKKALSSDG